MSAYNAVNGEWCGQSHAAAHATCCATSGASTGSSSATGSSACATPARRSPPASTSRCPRRMVRRAGLDAALAAGEATDADIDACVDPHARRPAAPRRPRPSPAGPGRTSTSLGCDPAHRGAGPGGGRQGRSCCCATNRWTARRCCRSTPSRRSAGGGARAARPTCATWATAAPATSTPRPWSPRSTGCGRAARRRRCRLRRPTPRRRRRRRRGRSSWSATPAPTRASSSATPARRTSTALLPGRRRPGRGGGLRGPGGGRAVDARRPRLGARTDAGGFSTGGDRASLRLHPEDEALIAAVAAANPRTVVAVDRRQRRAHGGVAPRRRRRRPALVRGHGGRARPRRRAARRASTPAVGCRSPCPTDADHLPPFDRDADAVTYDGWHGYWRLARDGHEAAFPFGFGLSYTTWQLGPDDARRRRRRPRRAGHRAATPATRDGVDVVQVYAGRPADRPARPAASWPSPGSRSRPAPSAGRRAPDPVDPPRRAGGRRLDARPPAPTSSPSAATAPTSTPSTSSSTAPTHPGATHPSQPAVEVRGFCGTSTAGSGAWARRSRGRRGWRRRPSRRACGGAPRWPSGRRRRRGRGRRPRAT